MLSHPANDEPKEAAVAAAPSLPQETAGNHRRHVTVSDVLGHFDREYFRSWFIDGPRLLLGRQPHYPPGRYSALAGFVEAGETIEAAVARELHEEAGIAVADVAYLASQPWPFPSSLMIGCTARALDDRLTIDTTELDDARWFTRDEVAGALAGDADAAFLPPPRFAIARTLLDHWIGDA